MHLLRAARLLREMPKPTLAALNGVVAGAGLSIASWSDLRVAAASAPFTRHLPPPRSTPG
jgi:2-(1,2-epoxy-1,2-dihydrophenyl)acetyl-CoA isomerase